MSETHEVQANGKSGGDLADGTNDPHGSGESGGGARKGQQAGGARGHDGFLGHGGQSEIGYHGEGRLGDQAVEGQHQPNSGSGGG